MKPVDAALTITRKRKSESSWCHHLEETYHLLTGKSTVYKCMNPKTATLLPSKVAGDTPCLKEDWKSCPFNRRRQFRSI